MGVADFSDTSHSPLGFQTINGGLYSCICGPAPLRERFLYIPDRRWPGGPECIHNVGFQFGKATAHAMLLYLYANLLYMYVESKSGSEKYLSKYSYQAIAFRTS